MIQVYHQYHAVISLSSNKSQLVSDRALDKVHETIAACMHANACKCVLEYFPISMNNILKSFNIRS